MMNKAARIIIAVILILFIIVISLSIVTRGDFYLKRSAWLNKYKVGLYYYIGYDVAWEGVMTPVIERVSILRQDGTLLSVIDAPVDIHVFIDRNKQTGVLDQEEYMTLKEQDKIDYIPAIGYKLEDKDIQLVFNIRMKKNYKIDAKGIVIEYKVFGVRKKSIVDIPALVNS